MEVQDVSTPLHLLKVLAHESRLKILGILANQECSVGELAALLKLKEPTVSHHLAKLKEIGLVGMRAEGNTHIYWLDGEALQGMTQKLFTFEQIAAPPSDVAYDAWERKVLGSFVEGTRLKEIPASQKKRLVILRWLVSQFQPGVRYPEREVNEVIKRHHPDCATLRRELIMNRLMQRDHGVYWRVPDAPVA
ncbi:MAG TPA: metalloregulator ArsR/SmtB family transcription factor [Herpetosiphonaceae bacterium]